jgi:hypothetical protein
MTHYCFTFNLYIGGKKRLGDYAVMYPNADLTFSWGDWLDAESKEDAERMVLENWPDAVDVLIRTEDEVNPPFDWGENKEAA